MTTEERFEDLVTVLLAVDGVTPPGTGRGFGAGAVRFHNKIFAMLVRGRLVVKLPAARVDALVAAGEGDRFDANKGTPMREWLSLAPSSSLEWSLLAGEALDFAARAQGTSSPQRRGWGWRFAPHGSTASWAQLTSTVDVRSPPACRTEAGTAALA